MTSDSLGALVRDGVVRDIEEQDDSENSESMPSSKDSSEKQESSESGKTKEQKQQKGMDERPSDEYEDHVKDPGLQEGPPPDLPARPGQRALKSGLRRAFASSTLRHAPSRTKSGIEPGLLRARSSFDLSIRHPGELRARPGGRPGPRRNRTLGPGPPPDQVRGRPG